MANYLEINEIRGRAAQGITLPFKCLANEGMEYFVKGKSLGIIDSIREWLGCHLALSFGLPVPEFCIVTIPIELLEVRGEEALMDLGEGPAFASKAVPLANDLRQHLIQDIPLELQKDILLFDAWTFNDDRELSEKGGNPNLLWASGKLHVIDHNNAFKPESFKQSHVFCNRMPEITSDMLTRQDYQAKMQSALESCWEKAWDTMPDEWKDQNFESNWINPDQLFEQLIRDAQGNIWERL